MTAPRFTAEASLYNTSEQHYLVGPVTSNASQVAPANNWIGSLAVVGRLSSRITVEVEEILRGSREV